MSNIYVPSLTRLLKLKLHFSLDDALIVAIAIPMFWISVIIAPYHVHGDQVHYTKAYNAMRDLDLADAFHAYRRIIFSFEPIHFFVSWVFSNLGFDKTFVMAALNGLLAALFGRFLLGRTKSYFIVVMLVFSNPYLYATFFTLEKLKVSMIFLLLFLNYRVKLFGILAVFAHLQVGLLMGIYLASRYLSRLRFSAFRKLLHSRNILRIVISALIAVGGALMFYDYAFKKIIFYMSREGVGSLLALVPTLVIFILTFITTNQSRKEVAWYFTILAAVIFFIGGDRVNMFVFFGFLYFTSYRLHTSINGMVFLSAILLSAVYLGYKSYRYLDMVVNTGG